ncbi:MAG: Error-prone repair protein ImuA [Bacteroidota bacterium]|nr:Error-prone repair protein ImuA [Bacteroidota bacterium]
MDGCKNHIITQLRKDILPLEGLKVLSTDNHIDIGFRPIELAFPNTTFPIGCTHEFLTASQNDVAPTNGFIAILLSKLMQLEGTAIWISASRTLFPAAINKFGITPDKIIFIDLKKEKDVLYVTEEALKCTRITSVVSEIKNITFKESRRFQLAAEQSRVTGFLLRQQPHILNAIACVSRWRITSLPSELNDGMPGVGFPRWNVELLKTRNGKPGNWKVEWSDDRLKEIKETIFSIQKNLVQKAV